MQHLIIKSFVRGVKLTHQSFDHKSGTALRLGNHGMHFLQQEERHLQDVEGISLLNI